MKPANPCRVEWERGTIILTPMRNLGELDSELFAADVDGVLALLTRQRARNVVVDLSKTDFFGSDAVHLFLKLHRRVREHHGRMAFCGASHNERAVLGLMGLEILWPLFPTRQDAIDFVGMQRAEILVVDDSEVDRCLVTGLLRRQGNWHVMHADSGYAALSRMRQAIPDLVITDLVMPEMDGLGLLREIRELYPLVPVILLTAYGNAEIAWEALRSGAISYVPKSRQSERLVDTVRRVLSRKDAHHADQRIEHCPAKIESTFYLNNEPARIRPVIDLVQYNLAAIGTGDAVEQIRIGTALEEALLNALYHGNLEVSTQELTAASADYDPMRINRLLRARATQEELRDRRIILETHITTHTARFVIRDEGPGFDPEVVAQPAQHCFESGENRGTMLMCALMDEVFYNEMGNQVTLIKIP